MGNLELLALCAFRVLKRIPCSVLNFRCFRFDDIIFHVLHETRTKSNNFICTKKYVHKLKDSFSASLSLSLYFLLFHSMEVSEDRVWNFRMPFHWRYNSNFGELSKQFEKHKIQMVCYQRVLYFYMLVRRIDSRILVLHAQCPLISIAENYKEKE